MKQTLPKDNKENGWKTKPGRVTPHNTGVVKAIFSIRTKSKTTKRNHLFSKWFALCNKELNAKKKKKKCLTVQKIAFESSYIQEHFLKMFRLQKTTPFVGENTAFRMLKSRINVYLLDFLNTLIESPSLYCTEWSRQNVKHKFTPKMYCFEIWIFPLFHRSLSKPFRLSWSPAVSDSSSLHRLRQVLETCFFDLQYS